MKQDNEKRLFWGLEVEAPWPTSFPKGRVLTEENRHLTLAFLGPSDFEKMGKVMLDFPSPSFKVGLVGKFDRCLFLPETSPRVVAWHVNWLDNANDLHSYRKELVKWLKKQEFSPKESKNGFLSHVTVCRGNFIGKQWKKSFARLPMYCSALHLYEGLGNSKYQKKWTYGFHPPFTAISHRKDRVYHIWGGNYQQLHLHAEIALAFHFPPFLCFFSEGEKGKSLEEVIEKLNGAIKQANQAIGSPFKTVSYFGQVEEKGGLLYWEMIIDL